MLFKTYQRLIVHNQRKSIQMTKKILKIAIRNTQTKAKLASSR